MICHTNTNKRESGVAKLISDKVYIRAMNITRKVISL